MPRSGRGGLEGPVSPNARKISGLIEALEVLCGILTRHVTTDRNDAERDVVYGLINVSRAMDTTRNSSSRAVVSAEVTINVRIVCEEESRDLSGK